MLNSKELIFITNDPKRNTASSLYIVCHEGTLRARTMRTASRVPICYTRPYKVGFTINSSSPIRAKPEVGDRPIEARGSDRQRFFSEHHHYGHSISEFLSMAQLLSDEPPTTWRGESFQGVDWVVARDCLLELLLRVKKEMRETGNNVFPSVTELISDLIPTIPSDDAYLAFLEEREDDGLTR